jgi:DNA modification methylase
VQVRSQADEEGARRLSTTRILHGDCRTVLPTLEAGSVQTCVSSPPYWGLRDYGTGAWSGGDAACDHKHETKHQAQGASSQRVNRSNADAQRSENFRSVCGKCGAVRTDQQIGLEDTPEEYVHALVGVFREVRRALRDDGTLWLNLGDSYASGNRSYRDHDELLPARHMDYRAPTPRGLKPKDLVGIPWRVAFALQADGWYLRADILWEKRNPQPESVLDRPTRAHEYVFLLSKSERYFYDADAIAEVATGRDPGNRSHRGATAYANGAGDEHHRTKGGLTEVGARDKRNKRSVWTIASEPYSGAHFAVMPTALVVPCILAGSRLGDTVLDPFGGSGTTGEVANELGRNAILIELNEAFISLGHERTAQIGLFG